MLVLAIDTSAIASAALLKAHDEDGRAEVLESFATTETNTHSEVLAPAIAGLLEQAGIDGRELERIVVGVGPGPFTGLRVGIATARTLGFAWGVPVDGVMSLDAIAWDVLADPAEAGAVGEGFSVAIDARRKELYWARYAGDGALLDGPHVGAPGDLPACRVYGAGTALYPEALAGAGATGVERFATRVPRAASLGAFALGCLAQGQELLPTTPLYLRESDAKVPAAMRKGTA
ncbi:tRNA (adenosine(37)-N6)-threonylcarbamoyltransferase complex dimerization subunit type 1 TsaB [Zafaria sp. J156]|uniref:tRNA (adenosine(37)-N6)-threonylcarbamoyltransferase complex dimerization subunit type 1 TsaB n=1 Tax=Zafaria sp. J156 TaxID=3116490 RepID=UPI002E759A91|nr:tRNA (adenosine(37)-N6)-threonylcarbamoyltransferase complex dimerization subunit type 1 TsaB [Zafaria sp. J156]MEE1620495.1 tRNA (adenosine(37)-N6)-threonylcarbamoyltransferase complex dimerization subunit type 1 TsaB [Zafaria sp. J156]